MNVFLTNKAPYLLFSRGTIEQKTYLLGILRKKQASKMDGFLVDINTANAILQVGNALNQSNQKKYGKLSIRKMASVAWKLVK